MPQAKITVNAVVGSNLNLPIATLVQLNNQNTGGESSYTWVILDQPPGPADALSSVSAQNPFFTPNKEGTYLIRLIVNQGLPTEQQDQVVCAVEQVKTGERIPAAGETTEADSTDGWATAMNSLLRRIDALLGDPGVFIGVNASGGNLTRGQVLRATASSVIKSGLPGQETVPGMSVALASAVANVDEPLVVCEGTISGATTVPNGALMKFRILGRFAGNTGGPAAAVGDSVYVTDTGTLSTTPGTTRRKVGSAMTAGVTYDVWFAGVGGEDITPIDRAYVVYGNPGMLTNAFRVDGNNASSVSGGLPFMIKTNDDTTVTFVLRRHSSSGLDIQEWQTSAGVVLASVDVLGNLVFAATSTGVKWPTVNIREEASHQLGLYDGTTLYADLITDVGHDAAHLRLYGAAMTGIISMDSTIPALQIRSDTLTSTPIEFHTNGIKRWQILGTGELAAIGGNRAIQNVLDPVNLQDAVTLSWLNGAVGPQNLVQNSGLEWFNRGTAHAFTTGAITSSTPFTQKTADRWWHRCVSISGGSPALTITNTRVAADANATSKFALRWELTSQPTGSWVSEVVHEFDRDFVKANRGKKLSVRMGLKCGSNFSGPITVQIVTGTGGTHNEQTKWGDYTGSTNIYGENYTPTTTFTVFKTGSTAAGTALVIPSNATVMALVFQLSSSANSISTTLNTLDITDVMVTASTFAPDVFRYCGGSREADRFATMQYVEASWNDSSCVGTTTGSVAAYTRIQSLGGGTPGTSTDTDTYPFMVHKKLDPGFAYPSCTLTVTTYDGSGANAGNVSVSNVGLVSVSGTQVDQNKFYLSLGSAEAGGAKVFFHYLADCDLYS